MKIRLLPKSRIGRAFVIVLMGILVLPQIYSRFTHGQRAIRLRSPIAVSAENANELKATLEPSTHSKFLNGDPLQANTLSIASFNIAHGRGLADSNLNGGTAKQRMQRFDEIAELLR